MIHQQVKWFVHILHTYIIIQMKSCIHVCIFMYTKECIVHNTYVCSMHIYTCMFVYKQVDTNVQIYMY